jgi:hypothetical protein
MAHIGRFLSIEFPDPFTLIRLDMYFATEYPGLAAGNRALGNRCRNFTH